MLDFGARAVKLFRCAILSLDFRVVVCYIITMKDKEEAKQAAAQEVPNYDEMWGVSGYYLDNDGNDIRDRD